MKNELSLQIIDYLKKYKKKTIALDELSSLFGGDISYIDFAKAVEGLVNLFVLFPYESSGFSQRPPRLYNKYRINFSYLKEDFFGEIKYMAATVHHKINLEYYFSKSQPTWEADKDNILKVDYYLKNYGLPKHPASAPERSYQIFGDEKFIDENSGKRLLQRLCLYDEMKIESGFDPAMFFINSEKFLNSHSLHKHLIIENRAPFYALSESEIVHAGFTSLIYGAGFNILSSIGIFEKQIDLQNSRHQYYYFGDLDYSGISIWHYVAKRVDTKPAIPFYNALMNCEAAIGKEYQQKNMEALNAFLNFFERPAQEHIIATLSNGKYFPQEALEKQRMQDIFINFFRGDYGN